MHISGVVSGAPPGVVAFGLVLVPLLAGLLVFCFRTRFCRKGFVVATGWLLTFAAVWLLLQVATQTGPGARHLIAFSPARIGGIVGWNTIVVAADLLLLAAFVALGAARRSPLIVLLALAQLVPVVWLEFGGGAPDEPIHAFAIDWLSVVMVLIVSVVGSIIAVYALPYMKQHEEHLGIPPEHSRRPIFFLVLLGFLGAMNGLVMANNLLWLYFFWEVTTLCSFLLIGHDRTEEARANAYRALWMNLLGGVAFVIALCALARSGPDATLSVQGVVESAAKGHPAGLVLLAMACVCLAGFTKAAQMPFQTWLLGAMVAPTPVSALLHSSTMVKAGVYLILRFAPVFHGTPLSDAVALSGCFTFVMGALLAVGQTNAKKVLAYSTISNLGLIIACAGLNTPLAAAAAVMLIIFHAISKGMLFMATGVVEHTIHSRDIEDMQGLVSRMPLTTTLMVLGILSMLLPPFGVLIAKLAAIESSVNLPPAMVLMVVGSTLTVVFWVKWIGRLLMADPTAGYPKREHLHNMYFGPLLLLTGGAIVFSLLVIPVLTHLVDPAVRQYYAAVAPDLVQHGLGGDVLRVPWWAIFGVLGVAVLIPLVFFHARKEEIRPAYMCGEQAAAGDESGFVSVADQATGLSLHGYYFDRLVGEQTHVRWATVAGALLIVALFGTVLPWS